MSEITSETISPPDRPKNSANIRYIDRAKAGISGFIIFAYLHVGYKGFTA